MSDTTQAFSALRGSVLSLPSTTCHPKPLCEAGHPGTNARSSQLQQRTQHRTLLPQPPQAKPAWFACLGRDQPTQVLEQQGMLSRFTGTRSKQTHLCTHM